MTVGEVGAWFVANREEFIANLWTQARVHRTDGRLESHRPDDVPKHARRDPGARTLRSVDRR